MDLQNIKAKLLTKCIEQQTEVIKQLQQEITDAQNQANDYGQPKDRYDAFRTKLMRQIELYAGQLDKANIVINTLQKIDSEKETTVVEFGALIITNKQKLFVSAGLGKVDINEGVYYAISPHVPIFNVLKGKKVGDEVVFNGMKIMINEIC
jgi:transcription elongation GreA/GreB family factor